MNLQASKQRLDAPDFSQIVQALQAFFLPLLLAVGDGNEIFTQVWVPGTGWKPSVGNNQKDLS